MKKLFLLLLAIFLVACPQLCRAEPLGCCAEGCEESSSHDHSEVPAPVHGEAVGCICAGATQVDEQRTDDLTPTQLPNSVAAWLQPLTASLAPSNIRHSARQKPPSGLAAFGDGLGVRAYLQNFRF